MLDMTIYYNRSKMKAFPPIFYGTAWKKDKTADLVDLAIRSGFRAIDTACQPKHYNEAGVGQGIARSGIQREQLFIQTKFTPFSGQDPTNIPYNPKDPLNVQVKVSLEVSLKNLQTTYLDSLVLHSPLPSFQKTLLVWKAFEEFVSEGKVRHLGISNCYNPEFFKSLYEAATIKPTFVQNRFYADSGYDVELRQFCKANKVTYQSFWTLTANPQILDSQKMRGLTKIYKLTAQQIFYLTLIEEGIVPLIGTTSKKHMEDDLTMLKCKIEAKDRQLIWALLK